MALGLAACVHNTGASSSTAVTGSTTTLARTANAHIGQELIISRPTGYHLGITVTQVIDPATSSTQQPTAGNRFVAAQVSLDNTGKQNASGNANDQLTIIGSDSHQYSAASIAIQNCSNFNSGQYTLDPGNVATGCVAFSLPASVGVASVKFVPSPGSVQGTWSNP
jgi:hypothetical protein